MLCLNFEKGCLKYVFVISFLFSNKYLNVEYINTFGFGNVDLKLYFFTLKKKDFNGIFVII